MLTSHVKASVLLLAITSLSGTALAATTISNPNASASTTTVHHAATVPAALRPALYQALAKDSASSQRIQANGCTRLPKPNLDVCFDSHGAHFSGAGSLALRLADWGRGHKLTTVKPVKPVIKANKVSYAHGDLTAWWRVLPMGLEQGFTIAKRPAGPGKLILALTTSRTAGNAPAIRHSGAGKARTRNFAERNRPIGELTESKQDSGSRSRASGMTKKEGSGTLTWGRLRYGKLVVTDAKGKVIPATLKSNGNRILIAINDARAVYPLTVDPLVWIAQKVTASDGETADQFGDALAVSGKVAIVGAPWARSATGAAYVFDKSNGTWTQVAKLTAGDGVAHEGFGVAVAIYGTTALVGADLASINGNANGAVYVFKESNNHWTQTQKLVASDGRPNDWFGIAVALSGTTALVGAAQSTLYSAGGAAYVFVESNGHWTQTAELGAQDGVTGDYFGRSVALSGTTAIIGAWGHDNNRGAAYIFTESNNHWTQTGELTANDGAPGAEFGISVALSKTTALVGAFAPPYAGSATSAAYVFSESNHTWTQTARLTASDGTPGDDFARSVALSGTTALVSAPKNNEGQGAAYVFAESNGHWTQTTKFTTGDESGGEFGSPVALSGATALIGSPYSNDAQGAAYFEEAGNLGLSASAPKSIEHGHQYVSQAIATNSGNTISPVVSVTMTVPAAASYISANATQGSCGETSNMVTCNFGMIDGNAGTATANFKFKATGKAGDIINQSVSVIGTTPALTAGSATTITNNPPVAEDGTLTTKENTAANGMLEASDADGDPLTFSIVDKPRHGSVEINDASTGAYTYTPANGYAGPDSFGFKANDGQADSNVATISITVKAAPPPPPSGGGGGGATGLLALLALIGLLALTRRRL